MKLSEMDRPAKRISLDPLKPMWTQNLQRLLRDIGHFGFQMRLVGGAVRDLLRNKQPRDLDFAVDALPDEIIYVLHKHDYEYSVKGINHGTVKVIFEKNVEEYEITALDFHVRETEGRIAISAARDWKADALARDFTVNSMSIDLEGNLYDYVGGLQDLKDQHIRFIGPYQDKIPHDPVLILRFFKLLSSFPNPLFDKSMMLYVRSHAPLLDEIKEKRVELELGNIEKGVNSKKVMALMCNLGLGKYIDIACKKPVKEATTPDRLYHGSTVQGLRHIKPSSASTNKHVGRAVYATDDPAVAVAMGAWPDNADDDIDFGAVNNAPYTMTMHKKLKLDRPVYVYEIDPKGFQKVPRNQGLRDEYFKRGEANVISVKKVSDPLKYIKDHGIRVKTEIEEALSEHSFAPTTGKTMRLWQQIDKADFVQWLCQDVLKDEQEREAAKRNPDAYRDHMMTYLSQRKSAFPDASFPFQF